MRTFTDSTGVEWTVFEVKRQGSEKTQWTYLPEQFGSGWLCFESDTAKRRLSPIPVNWRESTDQDLHRLLQQAQPVARPRADREDRPESGMTG
jgi:hypothetical protein